MINPLENELIKNYFSKVKFNVSNFCDLSTEKQEIVLNDISKKNVVAEKNGKEIVWETISLAPTHGSVFDNVEEFDMQNKLQAKFNYPEKIYICKPELNPQINGIQSDVVRSVYIDRLDSDEIVKFYEKFSKNALYTSDEKLLKIGKFVAGQDVDGVQLVRFTHLSSGMPILRVDYVVTSKDSPKNKTIKTNKNRNEEHEM